MVSYARVGTSSYRQTLSVPEGWEPEPMTSELVNVPPMRSGKRS